jgi:uncharacterized membrane protein
MSDSTNREPNAAAPSAAVIGDGGKQLAFVVYVLYLVGFFIGLTSLVGVIIAHMKYSEANDVYKSHFQYQIRTFWFGLLTVVVGAALSMVFIGYLVLLWWLVWTLVRCIKGMIRQSDGRPVENSTTLLW